MASENTICLSAFHPDRCLQVFLKQAQIVVCCSFLFFFINECEFEDTFFFSSLGWFFTGAVALVGWRPQGQVILGDAGDVASPAENQPEGKTSALAFKKNSVTRIRGFHWGLEWSLHRDESHCFLPKLRKTQVVTSWGI